MNSTIPQSGVTRKLILLYIPFRFSNLETDCFGGGGGEANTGFGNDISQVDHTKNAYMLVYEKRRKTPLRIVLPEDFA